MPKATAVQPALHDRINATIQSMNEIVLERQHVIRSLWLGLIGQVNVLQLGSPGTGKTFVVDELVRHIKDMPPEWYFWQNLTRQSVKEELIGPPDVKAIVDDGVFRHVTKGTMVDARVPFLDEVFKGNASTRSVTLPMFNEGFFLDGGERIKTNAWCLLAASNEGPESDEDTAFYDRLDLRHMVEDLKESESVVAMLKRDRNPQRVEVTVADIEAARLACLDVTIPDDVYEALLSLREALRREHIRVSDRKLDRCMRIIRASAVLRGATDANIEDVADLRFSMWENPEDRPKVDTAVLKLASPMDAELLELRAEIDKLATSFDEARTESDNETVRNQRMIEIHDGIKHAMEDIEGIEERYKRSSTLGDEQWARLEAISNYIWDKVYKLHDRKTKRAR